MYAAPYLFVATALLGLAACSNLTLSPAPAHEFPKTDPRMTAPPADIRTVPED